MGSEYDRKFEEMKEYIPFLERMIARLESTNSTSSNPRQAQLDKIKSLRDLLQDQKKRMKMENLLKCEQVLVNLYAKVEQKDKLPGISKPDETRSTETNKSDLDVARSKLKSVVVMKDNAADTLPEIARASETEVICTPGSKEPALFQRRPNRGTVSPRQRSPASSTNSSSKSPSKLANRRNYTRVLLSPEPSTRRWTESRTEEKQLFSRRSPQKSSRSPFKYYKKERKKTTNDFHKQTDLNIILKVPEHTLESLNTEDIVSRIMNCSDGDVDIDTLREVRSQIIGELKNTGAQDDISDLILKSYKHKKKSKKKQKGEIEEGELSDSESEAIGSIYGNLKIIEKEELPTSKNKSDDINPTERKIQISLVFNTENIPPEIPNQNTSEDLYDHENIIPPGSDKASIDESNQDVEKVIQKPIETSTDLVVHVEPEKPEENSTKEPEIKPLEGSPKKSSSTEQIEKITSCNTTSGFRANFYKPLQQTEKEKPCENIDVNEDNYKISELESTLNSSNDTIVIQNATESPCKPLSKDSDNISEDTKSKTFNNSVVSEIDILQALKNDILSESLSIPGAETATPPLHLPKITKVANTPETITKKRISIEKYKAKSSVNTSQPLFIKDSQKDTKKISLKLTEKEFERFKLNNLSVGDLSDDEIGNSPSATSNEIYSNLAPQSPENEDKTASDTTIPVIIPENPLKPSTTTAKADIDMRLLIPKTAPSSIHSTSSNEIKNKLSDPRMRRDISMPISKESPNPHLNTDRTSKSLLTPSYPNMTPNRTPSSMSFEMTPSHQLYDDQPIRKHIYAPTFSVTENTLVTSSVNNSDRQSWQDAKEDKEYPNQPDHRDKKNILYRPLDTSQRPSNQVTRSCDLKSGHSFGRSERSSSKEGCDELTTQSHFSRVEAPLTPSHYFGRGEAPMTQNQSLSRGEAPMTPSHSYGRSEAPMTPSHYFGRGDGSMTPSHSFGRGDGSMTPSHSFGRGERPMTPSHSYGRGEGSMTPSHSFDGSDAPVTTSHQFGRNKTATSSRNSLTRGESFHGFGRNDPRLNRMEYEKQYSDRGRYETERNYNARDNSRFVRGESIGRNDSDDQFDRRGRPYHREYIPAQRQSHRDYETEQLYTRDRGYEEPFHSDIEHEQRRYHDYQRRRGKSIGRPMHDDYPPRTERAPSMGRRAPSISRAPSIGKNTNSDIVSVKLPSDRTFNIDTNIRNTFQSNINPKVPTQDGFYDRRRRAASVGRTFARESSVGRYNEFNVRKQRATSVGRALKPEKDVFEVKNLSKKDYFHRSCSVGRDLNISKKEKSWNEIKAEFASFKLKAAKTNEKAKTDVKHQNIQYSEQRTKTNDKQKQNKPPTTINHSKQLSYSPRKNKRDPRVRKEQEQTMDNKDTNKHSKRVHSKKENAHGIVYSSDNIAQGKILGPGYGVKNYKIPKIKRPVEEVREEKQKADKIPPLDNKTDKLKKETPQNEAKDIVNDSKPKSGVDVKVKNKTETIIEDTITSDRITRLKKKTLANATETESPPRTRKPKKAIIESDSDEQEDESVKNKPIISPKPSPKPSPKKSSNKNLPVQDSVLLQNLEESLGSSFGIDDIEIFSENMVSDPVLNNIDDLIADLDNDLSNSKINVSFNDIAVDNICSTSKNNNCDTGENSIAELSAFLNEQINKNVDGSDVISVKAVTQTTENKEPVTTTNTIDKEKHVDTQVESSNKNEKGEIHNQAKSANCVNDSNEVIVSTSEISNYIKEIPIAHNTTPDSTVNASKEMDVALSNDDRLPDSTNEITKDNIDLNSTLKFVPSNETQAESKSSMETPDLESIGNLLTILQNKEKIKQLINMLGNQDQNDTIKKKLTKLSEIVESVEEDTKIEVDQKENMGTESAVVPDIAKEVSEDENPVKDKVISDEIFTNIPNEDVLNKSESLSENIGKGKTVMHVTEEKSERGENKVTEDKNDTLEKEVKEQENEILGNKISKATEPEDIVKKINKSNNKKTVAKKLQTFKKGKGKALQLKTRVTRANAKNKPVKKTKTELQKLQDDLKEMFLKTDILSTPGIRMCRLAKMGGDQKTDEKDQPPVKESEPVVLDKPIRKKPGPKPKPKGPIVENAPTISAQPKPVTAYKPGPKSKTKRLQNSEDSDPYAFDTDSTNDTSLVTTEPKSDSSSDSEVESNTSSVASIEPVGLKKKLKRKRGRGWQSGIIKTKTRKNKSNTKQNIAELDLKNNTDNKDSVEQVWADISIPDLDCFTDTKYCFVKGIARYHCRLCHYIGKDIVSHYKTDHPHSEVPLSRLHPDVARDAIIQCEMPNFQEISKMSTNKYVCRFCFQEFRDTKNVLERFFWHVASSHTGEYRQVCSECVNVTTCPMNLDIIPPPKDTDGQLIGYICEKCNYTQISLENLKHHVISRHDDQQTVVYSINLSVMTNEMIESLTQKCNQQIAIKEQQTPTLRSSLSSVSLVETSDICNNENSDREIAIPKDGKSQVFRRSIQSKISFENDDNSVISRSVKIETNENEPLEEPCSSNNACSNDNIEKPCPPAVQTFDDIQYYPHFKINFNDSGIKEYVCCINGVDNHYKTTLLISMKKHIQIKHSEIWDGYCFICRAIVTPQGQHLFKDCFQHCLDKHIDSFPILEKPVENTQDINLPVTDIASDNSLVAADNQSDASQTTPVKPYINVRPLAELMSNDSQHADKNDTFPKIESVVSLGSPAIESPVVLPQPSPTFQFQNEVPEVPFVPSKYEEAQSEIMSKKHRVVLDAMMSPEKLARIFKCAGRFCSFSTDLADEALLHATTHARVGGENALKCAYCDFDNAGNAIDLVTHVFKSHAICQFLCRQCFYRAGSSQLVGAHIERYHKQSVTAGSVLKSKITINNTITNDPSELLPRKIAVPFYVCNNGNPICNFKTYTPGKFTDHMIQKHGGDSSFPCSVCQVALTSPIELVKHLKTHGLMRYQCTWCVFGADNETDLLSHASEKHPAQQPQGYLRIITNKEGTNDYRVLPLANLNKYKVPFQEVTPSNVIENAVKEAERSVELEALIGSLIIDTVRSSPPQAETEINMELEASDQSHHETTETIFEDDLPTFVNDQQATPIKSEVPETSGCVNPPITPTVICLDSDDESSSSTPQKEASQNPTTKQVSPAILFKCPKCKRLCRNKAGFAKHVLACTVPVKELKCQHCSSFTAITIQALVSHLQTEHMIENLHCCSICNQKMATAGAVKRHMKTSHKVDEVSVSANSQKGYTQYFYSSRNLEPPPIAHETFRPQDVARLPINPIFDSEVKCAECEFSTKVRLNMVRHLQQHAQQQPAAATAPVNPVPVSGERYFDKMLNLASSSISSQRSGAAALAARYPRFVPERQRRACGAPGCDYISVDDAMLRRHWDTLHPGATHYRCLHCPPTQQLDTSQPLTATRILAHLKMHDETLYACSDCVYHHFRKRVVEKHNSETHSGAAQVLVVREEAPAENPPPATGVALAPAPTMDLKPWHCGLCEFKSMLRQQVAEHCSRIHRSKMQYKCSYCPYRASTAENVTKHQSNSHPNNASDIFYYYYKEGSVEDDADGGTPRWVRQKQKFPVTETEEVKPEVIAPLEVMAPSTSSLSGTGSNYNEPPPEVDLNIVKYEPQNEDSSQNQNTKFVQFCDPNGLKFKCPFCKFIMEDTREAMQSHLFEELKYRRWPCSYCSYKAFHKAGLTDHMTTEHLGANFKEPVALPINTEIETWVTKLLDHQSSIIRKNRDKLSAQRIQTLPTGSETALTKPKENSSYTKSPEDLEQTFGSIGAAVNMQFACPKCQFTTKDDTVMQNHLESELNNIRWSCSICSKKFVSYHKTQLHGKEHSSPARPLEVSREPHSRAAWVQLVLDTQRRQLQQPAAPPPTLTDACDNSLLAVRFEKSVPTPEEVSLARRKRSAPEDSDDEDRLLIDERPSSSSTPAHVQTCPHCSFQTIHALSLREHMLRHYKLKPYKCGYCDFTGHRKHVSAHSHANHPSSPRNIVSVPIPDGPPQLLNIANKKWKPPIVIEEKTEEEKLLCLICDKIFDESKAKSHIHAKEPQLFAKKNEVVVKCCRCTRLHKDVPSVHKHSAQCHPDVPVDYVYHKLINLLRQYLMCCHCDKVFNALKDLLGHHHLTHKNLLLNYTNYSVAPWLNTGNDTGALKRKAAGTLPQAKRTARKSTCKLPNSVAKKSTTKLPQYVYEDSDTEEYSYYGTKPLPLTEYENVTTMMPFCNTLMPFKMKQLRDIIHIEPIVLVKDCELDKLPK